jgi:hypothetical protein
MMSEPALSICITPNLHVHDTWQQPRHCKYLPLRPLHHVCRGFSFANMLCSLDKLPGVILQAAATDGLHASATASSACAASALTFTSYAPVGPHNGDHDMQHAANVPYHMGCSSALSSLLLHCLVTFPLGFTLVTAAPGAKRGARTCTAVSWSRKSREPNKSNSCRREGWPAHTGSSSTSRMPSGCRTIACCHAGRSAEGAVALTSVTTAAAAGVAPSVD